MGQSIHDVLLALGAKAVRDASSKENVLALDLELLEVRSVFGGVLKGEAMVQVSSLEAFAFQRPKELAQCGTLWLPGIETVEAVSQAIVDAHDTLRARLEDDQQSLRKLGLKPKLVSPDPRARAVVDVAGQEAQVAIDGNGDLVLESIGGQRVPSEHGRVFAPEDVDEHEAMERLAEHVRKLSERGVLGDDDDDEVDDDGRSSASGDRVAGDGFDVDVDGGDDWGSDDVSATASVPVSQTQATRHLSDNQLAELHAALSEDSGGVEDALADDDEDDADPDNEVIDASDEAEAVVEEDDATNHGIRVEAVHPTVDPDANEDDEPKTVTFQARKPSSLLEAFDNPESAMEGATASDADEHAPAIDDDDDYDEPTVSALAGGRTVSEKGEPPSAVRAAQLAAAALAAAQLAAFASDDESNSFVDDSDDDDAFAAGELRVDQFPALPEDSQDNEPSPTTVTPPEPAKQTMSLDARPRTSDEDIESVAAGFDDGEGERLAPRSPRPGALTMEEPPLNMPTKGTVSQPAEPPEDLVPSAAASEENDDFIDDSEDSEPDFEGRFAADDARGADAEPGVDGEDDRDAARDTAGDADRDGDDELENALVARLGAPEPSTPFAQQVRIEDDDLDDPNTARTRAIFLPNEIEKAKAFAAIEAASRAAARGLGTLDVVSSNGDVGVEDADTLEARASALEEEARALRERALLLRRGTRAPTTMSIDHSAGATSLPILGSMEVQVVSDDPTAALDVGLSPSEGRAPTKLEVDLEDPPPPPPPHDGVSLADVQAALGDIGALSGEATQVGVLRDGRVTDLKNGGHSGDSDVFESAGPPARRPDPTRVKQHDPLLSDNISSPEMGEESPAVEAPRFPSNLGGIGLVVEDPRARDRLKKHLTPRFRRLVEAPDAMTAAGLPEVSDVEALVFVRPRPDDATRDGILQLCDGPMPPRILIISSDARFDEMPEVSLRLPLGQRASEVAQQVLDGLRTLGVETLEASE